MGGGKSLAYGFLRFFSNSYSSKHIYDKTITDTYAVGASLVTAEDEDENPTFYFNWNQKWVYSHDYQYNLTKYHNYGINDNSRSYFPEVHTYDIDLGIKNGARAHVVVEVQEHELFLATMYI